MKHPPISRRALLKTGGTASLGILIVGTSACGPSKEKAVKVAGFVIDLSKEALPLLDLLGARDIAELVSTKALPALEKLKAALAAADIPAAGTTLTTVRNVLSGVANALLNLPESARRTTVIGILASINVLLLTVQAFVESEVTVKPAAINAAAVRSSTGDKLLTVLETTRQ
jgi:hypothetical protein